MSESTETTDKVVLEFTNLQKELEDALDPNSSKTLTYQEILKKLEEAKHRIIMPVQSLKP